MKTLVINKDEVEKLLSMSVCIDLMEKAFKELHSGSSVQPLRSVMKLPNQKGLLGMMPAFEGGSNIMGMKTISVFPDNYKHSMSSHQGVVLLFECETGKLLSIIDADQITAVRTAAVSALATKYLMPVISKVLTIMGTGVQAKMHLDAMLNIADFKLVKIWGRNKSRLRDFTESLSTLVSVEVMLELDAKKAVQDADIICTATSAIEPILKGNWIKSGAHINAVGSCTPSARELDSELVANAKLFTDSIDSLTHEAGDYLIPKNEGLINESHILGTLGELICEEIPARNSEEDITLFKSLGLAIEDLAVGYYLYETAKQKGMGKMVDI